MYCFWLFTINRARIFALSFLFDTPSSILLRKICYHTLGFDSTASSKYGYTRKSDSCKSQVFTLHVTISQHHIRSRNANCYHIPNISGGALWNLEFCLKSDVCRPLPGYFNLGAIQRCLRRWFLLLRPQMQVRLPVPQVGLFLFTGYLRTTISVHVHTYNLFDLANTPSIFTLTSTLISSTNFRSFSYARLAPSPSLSICYAWT